MNDHFQWLDVREYEFSGRVVKKCPHTLILGKLGRGNFLNSTMNPTKRGER